MSEFDCKIKMPKAMHEKWDTALRSGEYSQGIGALKCDDSYCCLGVLQMVVDGEVEMVMDEEQPAGVFVPRGVPSVEWLMTKGIQMTRDNCSYYDNNTSGMFALSYLNDNVRRNFVEIADFIKANVTFTDSRNTQGH